MKVDHLTRLLLLLVVISTVVPFGGVSAQQVATRYQVEVGQAHPDFLYPQITDGAPVSLSQYRGKNVLLLHFASW